jgi:hypothetical protein
MEWYRGAVLVRHGTRLKECQSDRLVAKPLYRWNGNVAVFEVGGSGQYCIYRNGTTDGLSSGFYVEIWRCRGIIADVLVRGIIFRTRNLSWVCSKMSYLMWPYQVGSRSVSSFGSKRRAG